MKVIYSLNNNIYKNVILTLGMFDGVHKAHELILKECVRQAKKSNKKSVCITYHPHPMEVLSKNDNNFKLLTTLDEKIELIAKTGIDILILIEFTNEFSKMSAIDFLNSINNSLLPSDIIVGYRTTFGANREGNDDFLKKFCDNNNINITIVSNILIDNNAISSSHIRKLIEKGKIVEANSLLGRLYSITGVVTHGDSRGRELGFNTANIKVDNNPKLLPLDGVYNVNVEVDNKIYKGILNIGTRPTFNRDFSIEVHILNFSEDIYNKKIKCEFIDYIRGVQKFNNKEELIKQIKDDIAKIV